MKHNKKISVKNAKNIVKVIVQDSMIDGVVAAYQAGYAQALKDMKKKA